MHVTLKPGVLDPQGEAVRHALGTLGFDGRRRGPGRQGDRGRPRRRATRGRARPQVGEMCEKLLANTVIENYAVEIA